MQESPVNRLGPHWPQTPVPFPPPTEEQSWREKVKSWDENLETLMGEHPKLTLAAAATIGLLLGWAVKRK